MFLISVSMLRPARKYNGTLYYPRTTRPAQTPRRPLPATSAFTPRHSFSRMTALGADEARICARAQVRSSIEGAHSVARVCPGAAGCVGDASGRHERFGVPTLALTLGDT